MVLNLAEHIRGAAARWQVNGKVNGVQQIEGKNKTVVYIDGEDCVMEEKESDPAGASPIHGKPLRKLRKTVSKISSSAKDQTRRVYELATEVIHGITRLAPEFSVPTLGDLEKLTTAFITISAQGDTVTVSANTSPNTSRHGKHDEEMIVISRSKFEDLQFSNERVNEVLHGTLRFLAEARTSTPSQVICKLIVHVTNAVGANLDPEYKNILRNLVGESFSENVSSHGDNQDPNFSANLNPNGTLTSTGLLVSYRECGDPLTWSKSRKIHRSMHYRMSLRPFQATIFLPAIEDCSQSPMNDADVVPALDRSCSPQSFPASPHLRSDVLRKFSYYTEDVLYRARDELRITQVEEELQLDPQNGEVPIVATFNPGDVHREITLSCGNHCASRATDGPHRAVRATTPILPNYPIYFEINCVYCDDNPISSVSSTEEDVPSVCVGLSTLNARLGFLVGSKRNSIGLASSGHLISGSLWMKGDKGVSKASDASFSKGGIIGVLVQIEDESDIDSHSDTDMVSVLTNFFVDGEPVTGLPDQLLEMRVPIDVEVYPTVSLSSFSTKVFGHFSAEDIVYGSPEQLSQFTAQESVYALDGSCVYHESCLYGDQPQN